MDGWWSFSFQGTRNKPDFVSDRRWGKPIHSRPPSSKAAPTIFSFLLLVTQKLHHAAASACHERRLGYLNSLSLSLSLSMYEKGESNCNGDRLGNSSRAQNSVHHPLLDSISSRPKILFLPSATPPSLS
ncbi:unnamed protein product, partial [Musa acuminata subsp. burmannicoides]